MVKREIWTIGHSTRGLGEFIEILKVHGVELLADIRRFPGSKRLPHFNRENLSASLKLEGIDYSHFEGLGGRRVPKPDSRNDGWRVSAFRGYADYMESDEFKSEVKLLQQAAWKRRTAYMCSEAVWWSCHRALVSDYLKAEGWLVWHILSKLKVDEHPWTKPARVIDGQLRYSKEDSLNF
jgi:uncharacterized protein (DUF488 family)